MEFKAEGSDGLEALTSMIQERVLQKIKWMFEDFDAVKHEGVSANLSGLFKLRLGDYRRNFLLWQ